MSKILVIDANSILNRAFYGIRPLTTSDGLFTNAVYGFINIVKKHLDAEKPDMAVAAFDVHAPTFRHSLFDAYKGTRKPMPEELRMQLPYIRRAAEALGLCILEKEGYEADDILGTLSLAAEKSGGQAVIVTGDRDSYQLVSEKTTLILAATAGDERITPEVIKEKYSGLSPKNLIDVKALMGDASDNIPGVPGIGEKTAVPLIVQCGSVAGVYASLDKIKLSASVRKKLEDGRESAFLSLKLAEICREVPLDAPLSDLTYNGMKKDEMRALLTRLEFGKMIHAFGLDKEDAPAPEKPAEKKAEPDGQISLFDVPEAVREEIQKKDARSLSDPAPMLYLFEDRFFVLDSGEVFEATGDGLEEYLRGIKPVVFDYKSYLKTFDRLFGNIAGVGAAFDLPLAAYVLNSQDGNASLSRLALVYLKKSISPAAESDPREALSLMKELFPVMDKAITENGLDYLYRDVELPLAYTLAKMEIAGFAVSKEGLEKYGAALLLLISDTEEKIYSLAGERFSINSPKQLGRILFEKMQLPAGKKNKLGYSTDADTLEKLRFASPIVGYILDYRAYTKLYSTYVAGLISLIAPDGRVHTVFNQMLTSTGRLSSAEPNLQNIPVRTELGRELRRFFVPSGDGFVLVDADYSQIELRILAHVSGDKMLSRFFVEGLDIHTKTASEIFKVAPEEVTPEMRKRAKAVNFGIVYGIGEYSLSQDLGISLYEAKDYIRDYFALFPDVKRYLDETKRRAHETGFVVTAFGRKRVIPELSVTKKSVAAFGERAAMNAPIQGTAADIIKTAMVNVDRRLEKENMKSRLVLQVHDELIIESPEDEAEKAARILSEEMENAVSFSVPLTAEAKIGASWYEAH